MLWETNSGSWNEITLELLAALNLLIGAQDRSDNLCPDQFPFTIFAPMETFKVCLFLLLPQAIVSISSVVKLFTRHICILPLSPLHMDVSLFPRKNGGVVVAKITMTLTTKNLHRHTRRRPAWVCWFNGKNKICWFEMCWWFLFIYCAGKKHLRADFSPSVV